jgi:hypothetical protein
MDIKTLQKDNADLQKQNNKRNFVIAGFMIAGAVGGFVIAKSMKTKTLVQIGATVGGSLLLGVPVLLMTRKKAVERTKKIKENEEIIKGLQSIGVMTNVVKQNLPNLDMFNVISKQPTVQVSTNPKPGIGVLTVEEQNKINNTTRNKPGIGVLTVEEQNKMTNPLGTVSLNRMV